MKKYSFTAKIEEAGLGGACVLFPYDVQQEFGTRGRIAVNATFDGIPYRGSMIEYGWPRHMLGMLKGIREQLGKNIGDTVEMVVWKDEAERTVEVPAALAEAMKQAKVTAIFEALSFTNRKEYCRWVSEAKREETRVQRVSKAVELLAAGVKTPESGGRS